MILVATWDESELRPATGEALGAAASLAAELGDEVALVAFGSRAVAETAGRYGATRAVVVEGDVSAAGSDGALAALAELARELDARVVLLA
ncbi:MAG: hypothetical protein ACYC0H_11760, partial [Solirubrobacteraceae bacterium]